MLLQLYFDEATGCLIGINLNREPAEGEVVIEYEGEWPPLGYTYRYNSVDGTVSLVPESECADAAPTPDIEEVDDHPAAVVWLSRTLKLSSRGAFGVPFDSYEDSTGIIKGINHGVPIIGPGTYHIWGTVTYSVLRRFSIISRDLVLTINGEEFARYSISIYTRAQFTQNIGPVRVELTSDRNAIGLISETTVLALNPKWRIYTHPVAVVGSKRYTSLWIERL